MALYHNVQIWISKMDMGVSIIRDLENSKCKLSFQVVAAF